MAILVPASTAAEPVCLRETQASARSLKIKVTTLVVRGPEDYESAFRTASKERVQTLVVGGTPFTSAADRKQIIDLATRSRLPAIYDTRDWAENGGLISYGADRVDMYRRAAMYVDKILRGAKPADLPIEQPTKVELVVNLPAAKKIGLTIPQSILVRAERVIE